MGTKRSFLTVAATFFNFFSVTSKHAPFTFVGDGQTEIYAPPPSLIYGHNIRCTAVLLGNSQHSARLTFNPLPQQTTRKTIYCNHNHLLPTIVLVDHCILQNLHLLDKINMARGKFNKRGGGARLDAQSAEEIELRNERLAAFEDERARRRAEEAEDGEEGGEEGEEAEDETVDTSNKKKKKPEEEKPPVKVTTDEEHRKNLAKLAATRKRREIAEKKRKQEEEAAEMIEAERKLKAASLQAENEDDGDKKKKKSETNIPKLSKIEIKKMKPALLKEALKQRDLDIQGNAKALMARLLAYEEAR